MAGNAVAVEPYLVSGIEWELDQRFHFGKDQAKYLQENVELNKVLPIKGVEILFGDDIWDFNPCFRYRSGNSFTFSFQNIPEGFVVSAKYFVLMTMMNSDKKISTIKRRFNDLRAFFREMDKNHVKSPDILLTRDIKLYLDTFIRNHGAKTSCMMKTAVYEYCRFLSANYEYGDRIDINVFDGYGWLIKKEQKERESKKTTNIPEEYFTKLMQVLIQVMNDQGAAYRYRAVACVYVILSQTGLRITEIHALTADALQKIEVKGIDEAYFLKVKEFKPASKQEEYLEFQTFANSLTVNAFKTLQELSREQMEERGNSFIYQPNCKYQPAPDYVSLKDFKELLFKYAPFAVVNEGEEAAYEGLTVTAVGYGDNKKGYVVSPTTKQFRVHLCTELYHTHHVSMLFIQRFMGHLSDEMQGYYVRSKNKGSEEAKKREELLKDVVQKKVTLLGGRSKEISEQIDAFINAGKYNIAENVDELVKALDGKLAIRVKRSGFCIKATSYRECSRDAKTNEIYCAYDICPNLCHVYYMASDSYTDFKLLQKTFEENVKNGFDLQASRELNKLKAVCRIRLLPEMEDLKKKIQLRSIQTVLMDYPELEYVVKNYDAVMEEIEHWRKKNY